MTFEFCILFFLRTIFDFKNLKIEIYNQNLINFQSKHPLQIVVKKVTLIPFSTVIKLAGLLVSQFIMVTSLQALLNIAIIFFDEKNTDDNALIFFLCLFGISLASYFHLRKVILTFQLTMKKSHFITVIIAADIYNTIFPLILYLSVFKEPSDSINGLLIYFGITSVSFKFLDMFDKNKFVF